MGKVGNSNEGATKQKEAVIFFDSNKFIILLTKKVIDFRISAKYNESIVFPLFTVQEVFTCVHKNGY